jgi:NAD-specific glutamate dehydrogenase
MSVTDGHASMASPIAAIRVGTAQVVSSEVARNIDREITTWAGAGADANLARDVAKLFLLASALDIAQSCETSGGTDLLEAARTYLATGEVLKLAWCRTAALALEVNNAWERMATDASLDDLTATGQTSTAAHLLQSMSARMDRRAE